MTDALVIVCGKCGGLLLAKTDQKTRTCPYCGSHIITTKAKRLASAKSVLEASEILKKLKTNSVKKQ